MKNAFFKMDGSLAYIASGDNQNLVHEGVFVVTVPDDTDPNLVYWNFDENKMAYKRVIELKSNRTVLAPGETAEISGGAAGDIVFVNGDTEIFENDTVSVTAIEGVDICVVPGPGILSSAVHIRVDKIENLQNEVRAVRDAKLQLTDWTQMPDVQETRSAEFKKAAKDYRQALRDITDNQPEATLDTVQWPKELDNGIK